MTCPVAPHAVHGPAVTIWPSSERRTWRTSPLPSHVGTPVGMRARRATAAGAALAFDGHAQVEGLARAHDDVFEGEIEERLGVVAARRAARAASRRPLPPKNASKRSFRPNAPASNGLPAAERTLRVRAFGTEHVVAATALGVAERLVRLVDLLEPLDRGGIVGIHVGVVLARQPAERLLDLVVGRVAADAQDLVVVHGRLTCVWVASIMPGSSGKLASELLGDGRNRGLRLAVVHARRPEHADGSAGLTLDEVGREHERALAQIEARVLGTDADGEPGSEQLAHQRREHDVLLEQLEETSGVRGDEGIVLGREPARTADVQRLVLVQVEPGLERDARRRSRSR